MIVGRRITATGSGNSTSGNRQSADLLAEQADKHQSSAQGPQPCRAANNLHRCNWLSMKLVRHTTSQRRSPCTTEPSNTVHTAPSTSNALQKLKLHHHAACWQELASPPSTGCKRAHSPWAGQGASLTTFLYIQAPSPDQSAVRECCLALRALTTRLRVESFSHGGCSHGFLSIQ